MADQYFNQLYDGSVRPHWAAQVHVNYNTFDISNASSDRRILTLSRRRETVNRPNLVSGIILPTSTTGRVTEDVSGRDLARFPEDRGHLMAYSLGAPQTELIMVPQPRSMNQDVSRDSMAPNNLNWRNMEIFLAYAALVVMGIREDSCWACCFKSWRGLHIATSIFRKPVIIRGFRGLYSINGTRLNPPDASTWSRRREPRFALNYRADVEGYNRMGTPTVVRLRIHLIELESDNTYLVIDKRYDWEETEDDQDTRLDRLENKYDDRRRLLAESEQYKRERLGRRYRSRHDSGDESDDY